MLQNGLPESFSTFELPKMFKAAEVNRHCLMCKQHGIIVKTKGHVCAHKKCDCTACAAIRNRRQIMSMQIKLRRHQDKLYRANTIPIGAERQEVPYGVVYTCQRCKNHGLIRMRKYHSRECLYANCVCEMCVLVRKSTKIEGHHKKLSTRMSEPALLHKWWLFSLLIISIPTGPHKNSSALREPEFHCF
ncbi:unnamed protein product, partial [Mesorhabditis spiculigera]